MDVSILCLQADVGTAGAGGGRAIELPQAASLNPLQYIQGLAKAITGDSVCYKIVSLLLYPPLT